MKRIKQWLSLFLSLLLLAGLTACQSADSPDTTRDPEDITTETPGEAPSRGPIHIDRGGKKNNTAKKVSVSEMISEDGSGTDNYGTEFTYSFHVPQIDDETEDAEILNEEIAENFGPIVEDALDTMEDGMIPGYCDISYEDYRSNGILFLVLKLSYYYEPSVDYVAYSYDMERGVMLTNAGVLEALDVTEEDFLDALRAEAVQTFDNTYFSDHRDYSMDEDGQLSEDARGEYQRLRAMTLSERSLNLDLPLYLDNGGVLHVITPMGSFAGADYYYADLTPDLSPRAGKTETDNSVDFVTVKRQGRTVTLRFNRTEDGEILMEQAGLTGVSYGRDYPVHGLYSDYVKMLCVLVAPREDPDLFLLTREGRVEYVDLGAGMKSGYFCASGPLLGAEDVTDFEPGEDGDGFPTLFAVTGDGAYIDLYSEVILDRTAAEARLDGVWHGERTVNRGADKVALSLDLTNPYDFILERGDVWSRTGYLSYLGMAEQGAIYACHLWEENEGTPAADGIIALDRRYEYEWGEFEELLYVTELGGQPLFGGRTGEVFALTRSYAQG